MELSPEWVIAGLLRGGLYALMAAGLSLTFGVMNVCNFAHGEFYVLGAYLAYFAHVTFGLPPVVAILVAAAGAFVVGMIAEKGLFKPLRNRSKDDWIMNTFLLTAGLSVAMRSLYKMAWGVKYRGVTSYWDATVPVTSTMSIAADRVVAFVVALVVVGAFWLFLQKTRTGRAMRAVSQDERGARLMGINLDWVFMLTFALGCMLAGIGGATLLSLSPAYPLAGSKPLISSWYVVTIVGLGNIGGSILGGFVVGILETFSYYQLGQGWQDVANLAVLIIILLVKRSGWFGSEVRGALER